MGISCVDHVPFSRPIGECRASACLLALADPWVSTGLGHTHKLWWDCRRVQGLGMPTVANKVDGEHRNGAHHHLYSQRALTGSCPSSRCFKISKLISFTFGLCALQTVGFLWGPRGSESVCESFWSKMSFSSSPLVHLDVSPVGFQSQTFGGSSLQCRSQGLRCLMWGMNPSLIGQKLHICEIPSVWGWGYGMSGETMSLPLLPFSIRPLSFVGKEPFS